MARLPRTCLVGAGSSGIAALKALVDRGLPVDCFEASDRVGGNWVFGNVNGTSSAYRGLYINTSRERMQFASFPMPRDYPDFPHHTQIAAYFERFVDFFGLRDHIRFGTRVAHVERRDDGTFEVRLAGGEVRTYDVVLVANGHHWDPLWPDPPYPGRFDGRELHAHDYKDPEALRGRHVLVVGMGNSAMDIAVEASEVAARTWLSARRGAWIIPKLMLGRPLDQWLTSARVPFALRRLFGEALYRLAVGDPTRYGLPKPDHRLGHAHPTISGRILDRLAHGAVRPKPGVAKKDGAFVEFVDGTRERVDVIVWCTGYKVTFPFFSPSFVAAEDNALPLFRRVFHPGVPGLAFVGLLQPLGAIMPLAEAQGELLAEWLAGEYALPSPEVMRATVAASDARMQARYVRSKRHTMQVDFDDYLLELARERRAGKKRALRGEGQRFALASARNRDRASA